MLYAPWDVCPGTILLALRHVVPPPCTDHGTSVPHIGLRTVARESRTGYCYWAIRIIIVIIVIIAGDLLALPGRGP